MAKTARLAEPPLDLVIKRVRVVRPHRPSLERLDLGVKDGRFARIAPDTPVADARQVYDAGGRLGFPGVVDAHTHVGIYAYHLAPIASSHVDEMEALAVQHGVPSFKIFMFHGGYGGYGLHGQAGQDEQRRFLMIGPEDTYDLAHFEFILRAAGRIQREHPALAEHVSVSLHCELADILNAYTRLVARDATLTGLRAYSAARPPHSEGLDRHFVVRAAESPSAQGYSPFEGQEPTGRVTATFLRGALAWEDGKVVGGPRGRFLARPCGARRPA